jgi:hypothetical protein
MISTLWGVLVWKEFAGADTKIKLLLVLMVALFLCGLTMVAVGPQFAR